MKYILGILLLAIFVTSCTKNETPVYINVEGYWSVQDPTYSLNSTVDLYHLFKGKNVYYRFSFLKTHDFSVLTSSPRADSMIAYYQVYGNQLQLPNPAPSNSTFLPGNNLISQSADEMVFERVVPTKLNVATGAIELTRTDTIRYKKVSESVKIAYFDNYLKKWHP